MKNAYICAGCNKPGYNPPGIPVLCIEGAPHHPLCHIKEIKRRESCQMILRAATAISTVEAPKTTQK